MKKGSFQNMKKQNQKNILFLIKSKKGISRAQIADQLEISRATVTNIVRELIKANLVQESKEGQSSGGRKPMLLEINPEGAYVIGFEWGITHLKAVLLNLEAKIIARDFIKITDSALQAYLKPSFSLVEKYQGKIKNPAKIIGIGLGVHGLVDPQQGISIFAPHFNWDKVNLKHFFKDKFSYPIFVDNDVRMMAVSEIWQGRKDFAFINTGSGIGAALVFKGGLHYGNNFAAGEFGHLKIADQGPLCHCGKHGCLETLAGQENILQSYLNQLKQTSAKQGEIKFIDLIAAYQNGEKAAEKAIFKAIKYFSRAVVDLVNLLNPEAVIIGGLFADYENIFIDKILAKVKAAALEQAADKLVILTPYYQNLAGAVGAAEQVLTSFFKFEL
jgi:predicted NBD/HSP70 family sugar kinase